MSIAIGALQLMLDRGELKDWFGSTEIWAEAAIAAVAGYLFIVHTATAGERSFLNRSLLKNMNFAAGTILMFFVGGILSGTLALVPTMLQSLMDYPVFLTGLVTAPRGVGTMAAMFFVGRLMNRLDHRLIILAGLLMTVVSLWQMTGFSLQMGMAPVITSGVLQGFGLGCTFVPLNTLALSNLPRHIMTQGTALRSLMRNLGGSIGISVFETLLIQNTQIVHSRLVEHLRPDNPLARAPFLAAPFSLSNPSGLAALNAEVTRQASMVAYIDVFTSMMIIVAAMIPLLLVVRPPQRTRAAPIAVGAREFARGLTSAAASYRIRFYQPRDLNRWRRSNFPYHSLLSPLGSSLSVWHRYETRAQLRLSRARRGPPVRATLQPAGAAVSWAHPIAVPRAGLPRPPRRDQSGRSCRSARDQADDPGASTRSHGGGWLDRAPTRSGRPPGPPVGLTEKARPILARILDLSSAVRSEAFADLTDVEGRQLVDLLRRVHGNLCDRIPPPLVTPLPKAVDTERSCRAISSTGRGRFITGRGPPVTTSADNEASSSIGALRAAVEGRPAILGRRRSWRQRLRLPLMLLGPIVVLLARGYWYLTTGRYVSTDDAYVAGGEGFDQHRRFGPRRPKSLFATTSG